MNFRIKTMKELVWTLKPFCDYDLHRRSIWFDLIPIDTKTLMMICYIAIFPNLTKSFIAGPPRLKLVWEVYCKKKSIEYLISFFVFGHSEWQLNFFKNLSPLVWPVRSSSINDSERQVSSPVSVLNLYPSFMMSRSCKCRSRYGWINEWMLGWWLISVQFKLIVKLNVWDKDHVHYFLVLTFESMD